MIFRLRPRELLELFASTILDDSPPVLRCLSLSTNSVSLSRVASGGRLNLGFRRSSIIARTTDSLLMPTSCASFFICSILTEEEALLANLLAANSEKEREDCYSLGPGM